MSILQYVSNFERITTVQRFGLFCEGIPVLYVHVPRTGGQGAVSGQPEALVDSTNKIDGLLQEVYRKRCLSHNQVLKGGI